MLNQAMMLVGGESSPNGFKAAVVDWDEMGDLFVSATYTKNGKSLTLFLRSDIDGKYLHSEAVIEPDGDSGIAVSSLWFACKETKYKTKFKFVRKGIADVDLSYWRAINEGVALPDTTEPVHVYLGEKEPFF